MGSAAPLGRVYRMSWWFRGFAVFFVVFGCLTCGALLRGVMSGETEADYWKVVIAILLPAAGALMTAHAFVSRISFSTDAIERVTLLGRKRFQLSAIRGRREYVTTGGEPCVSTRYLRLERNDEEPPIDLGKTLYAFDDRFWQWYNGLQDMDTADKVAHKDSNFGLV